MLVLVPFVLFPSTLSPWVCLLDSPGRTACRWEEHLWIREPDAELIAYGRNHPAEKEALRCKELERVPSEKAEEILGAGQPMQQK